jgi:hypothetical protein
MSERGQELFNQLQTPQAIRALIGQPEDAHLDCKEWTNDRDGQSSLAKAACGLTNAEGGVLIIGMKARPTSQGEPDLVESTAPVADTSAVKSRILDLVGQLVEPGIQGIQAAEVNEPAGSKSGFVVLYVPSSEGPARRSRKDWKFYLRIGSGTFPMEYFQIEERFGKRPPPKLELYLEPDGIRLATSARGPARCFVLGLQNVGSGMAKFPSIRYRRAFKLTPSPFGIDGNYGFGLPQRPSDNEWVIFGAGVDEVIYPGEIRKITKLSQEGRNTLIDPRPQVYPVRASDRTLWAFNSIKFECEISCEGGATKTVEKAIPEESVVWP